ncbi:hypothetical protein BaRGS_00014681 [Batillaria attramentaria]|uniref:F-box domain-containing protein n=1 Tax=Batillaria attramentaria TaxID=370345 RepID=A0ABD0L3Y8_9CAEN
MSDKDLVDFRKKWLQEIRGTGAGESAEPNTGSNSPAVGHASASSPPAPADRGNISSNPSLQCADDHNAVKDLIAAQDNRVLFPEDVSNVAAAYYPFRILTELLNQSSTEVVPRHKKRTSGEVTSPTKRTYFSQTLESSKKVKLGEEESESVHTGQPTKHKEGYLDLFIADLDEINEIPFFDTSLPREVAVKIFWHLDFRDLCRCAQVSRSWRSLAEDELLWCRICHMMGFEQNKLTVEYEDWKSRVRHFYTLKHTLIYNWKNRIGRPFSLQHAKGGVLCAATAYKSAIVAGYSNCQTKMWDVLSGETCVFQPSTTALVIDEAEDVGTIVNEILHVATCDSVTAASYSHGFVDVWSNEEGTEPAYTFPCPGPGASQQASGLGLCENQQGSVYLAVNSRAAVQVHVVEDSQGRHHQTLQFNTHVTNLKWIQPPEPHIVHAPVLTVATYDSVSVCTFYSQNPDSTDCREIHNIIDAPVTCIDCRREPCQVVVGFSVSTGPSQFFKANVYDVATRRMTSTLTGHTSTVSCVNMADSPPHQLVTGSRDRKVRVYDTRIAQTSMMTLIGHSATVSSVQMDTWKVVSGDESGFVCVWDQRMASKLWDTHNRHPVRFCHFEDRLLVVAHVPYVKQQYGQYDYDTGFHQRHRGSLHVHDFLVDQTTKGVPEICLSSYDEPQGYNYNIALAVPYDTV